MNGKVLHLRWLLAAFGVTLFLALWFSVHPEWSPWSPFGQYLPAPRRIAIALNAPAYIIAGIVNEVLGYNPYKGDAARAFACAMVPSVFVVCFLTGRWFDHKTRVLEPKLKRHPGLRFVGVVVLFATQLLVLYRCFYFVRGGIAGWHGETPVDAAHTYGLAGWLFLWQWMAVSSWRDSRVRSITRE